MTKATMLFAILTIFQVSLCQQVRPGTVENEIVDWMHELDAAIMHSNSRVWRYERNMIETKIYRGEQVKTDEQGSPYAIKERVTINGQPLLLPLEFDSELGEYTYVIERQETFVISGDDCLMSVYRPQKRQTLWTKTLKTGDFEVFTETILEDHNIKYSVATQKGFSLRNVANPLTRGIHMAPMHDLRQLEASSLHTESIEGSSNALKCIVNLEGEERYEIMIEKEDGLTHVENKKRLVYNQIVEEATFTDHQSINGFSFPMTMIETTFDLDGELKEIRISNYRNVMITEKTADSEGLFDINHPVYDYLKSNNKNSITVTPERRDEIMQGVVVR